MHNGNGLGYNSSPKPFLRFLALCPANLWLPTLGKLERPDVVAEWLGVPTRDPDSISKDKGRMLVPFLPVRAADEPFPLPAIGRIPRVAPIA